MPFILRGVSLLGVDSVNAATAVRSQVWERLATDLKPRHLQSMVTTVDLESLTPVFERILKSQIRGRTVVKVQT
jgi:hypothetical protein